MLKNIADAEPAVRGLSSIGKFGLFLCFPYRSAKIVPVPRIVFRTGQWWRLDRFGLGRDGPLVSTISRRLRMRPERIRKPWACMTSIGHDDDD